jgi:plastocyanin
MMRGSFVVVVVAVAFMMACDRGPSAVDHGSPLSPSAVSSSAPSPATVAASAQGRQDVVVNMQDACDPDTFNAAIGPGTCLRAGGMQFDRFIAQLGKLGFVGPWHFAPNNANVQVGQTFVATNRGGEVHTFTEVEEFGGGIVPLLNQLSGVPKVAPECTALEGDDFVPPGGTYRESVEETGTVKFQCCIHPWMRLEAKSVSR